MHSTGTVAIILLLALIVAPSAASAAERGPLSAHDAQLLSQTGFDRQVFEAVREETRSPLHRLSGYDEDGYQILVNGLTAVVPHGKADQVLAALRRRLAALRYQAFIIEESPTVRTDRIAILRGTDQYEILRVMHTHGEDSEVAPQDIIDVLKEWEKQSPFDIVGAENDWVELEFRVLPKDLKTFINAVIELCPDAVDGSPGEVAELVRELVTTRRLLLWWE